MTQTFDSRPNSASPVGNDGISLYVHVPFCLSKCPYCDFNTYQGIESQFGDFLTALTGEIEAWAQALGRPAVNTIFLGGGTPSYLPDGDVGRILETIAGSYSVRRDAEITAECNPNDLTAAKCAELKGAGINRISMGVQSMDNGLLAMLGRRHDAAEAVAALDSCRRAGFDNVNLDLMYGLPQQTLEQWRDTVERIVRLAPEHISMYSLTLEEGTPLLRWVQQGRLPEPDADLAADMYDLADRNWARPAITTTRSATGVVTAWSRSTTLPTGATCSGWAWALGRIRRCVRRNPWAAAGSGRCVRREIMRARRRSGSLARACGSQ